jgi:hypothetical protein
VECLAIKERVFSINDDDEQIEGLFEGCGLGDRMIEGGRVDWYEEVSLSVVRYVGRDVEDVAGPGPP